MYGFIKGQVAHRYHSLMHVLYNSFAQHELLEEYDAHLSLPPDFRNTFTADLNSSFHIEYGFTGNTITHHGVFYLVTMTTRCERTN